MSALSDRPVPYSLTEPVPYSLTAKAEALLSAPECHPYPTFDDDPARWGLKPPEPMTEAEAKAAELAEVWGPAGPPASYAEWLAELQEPEVGP
jgi:hypothetical protein